jgi:hypothetical protein
MRSLLRAQTASALLICAAAAALPAATLILVGRHEVHPGDGLHFYGVGFTAVAATAAAVLLTIVGARRGDSRTVLVGTAFSVMAALLALHGLATPGIIVSWNGLVAFTGGATLPVGAAILALAALRRDLKKPGSLGEAEFAIIKKHPEWGHKLLGELGGFSDGIRRLVLDHHEQLDGRVIPTVAGHPSWTSRRASSPSATSTTHSSPFASTGTPGRTRRRSPCSTSRSTRPSTGAASARPSASWPETPRSRWASRSSTPSDNAAQPLGREAPSMGPHSPAGKAGGLGKGEGGFRRRVIAGQKRACIA